MKNHVIKTEDAPEYRAESSRAAEEDQVIARALQILANRIRRGPVMESPNVTAEFLRVSLGTREHEVFACLFLDCRHRVISVEEIFRGTIDGASVFPREIVKAALKANAAAVIFAHNHPSGNCEPSTADEQITRRLMEALALVDIRVLDHIIVSASGSMSFAERGMI